MQIDFTVPELSLSCILPEKRDPRCSQSIGAINLPARTSPAGFAAANVQSGFRGRSDASTCDGVSTSVRGKPPRTWS